MLEDRDRLLLECRCRRKNNKTPPYKHSSGMPALRKSVAREYRLQNTTSGDGEQFLLLDCRAQAGTSVVFFHGHRDLRRSSFEAQSETTTETQCGMCTLCCF